MNVLCAEGSLGRGVIGGRAIERWGYKGSRVRWWMERVRQTDREH